jgi:hypothetical protein
LSNLTDNAEVSVLNFIRNSTPTAPTLPLKVALTTTMPTDAAAGTEASGGSYARQTVTFTTPATPGGTMSNTAALVFTNMPACTVVACEVWDSAGSPVRWLWLPLTASKTYLLGDVAQFDIGALVFTAA